MDQWVEQTEPRDVPAHSGAQTGKALPPASLAGGQVEARADLENGCLILKAEILPMPSDLARVAVAVP